MTFRALALVLGLLFAATPVLGLICAMDCDQPPAVARCHESAGSTESPTVRGAHHPCNHDHTASAPALLMTVNARDSVETFITLSVATLAHATVFTAASPTVAMHGPPGLSSRNSSTPSRITVLRI